jgi:4-amino-4-deoxy-L-arabinose transferase-like glycosyltransferase
MAALRLSLGVTALLAVVYMFMRQAKVPYGEWDSWAIWTMRARYLFLGQTEWRDAFSEFLHGSDYPVLISFYIARNWTLLGQALQIVPQLLGITFGLNTVGFLLAALRQARGEAQGLLGAFVLIVTPTFLYWSANQYADVPLSFFILVMVACLYFYSRSEAKPPALLFVAGLAASLAMWSKNEGAFLLGGVLAVAFLGLFLKSPGHRIRNWGWFVAGLLPGLLLLLIFKLTLVPESYVMRQSAGELIAKIHDSDRTDLIWQQFKEELVNFGVWRLPMAGVLLGYGLLVGPNLRAWRKEWKILGGIGLVLLVILCGSLAAYQITTLPLEWQLRKSMERLLLQVFPAGLFWMFLLVRNPLTNDGGIETPDGELMPVR